MKATAIAVLVLVAIIGAYLLGTRRLPGDPPIVFISSSDILPEHADEIRQACPSAAFALSDEPAEYVLSMGWDKDRWTSMLIRKDSVLLMKKDSPDYKQIVREACRAIQPDTAWLSDHRTRKSSEPRAANEPHAAEDSTRYELRDIHDGSISRSALLDKRTGKIWAWHSVSSSVKGWLLEEDIVPEPDK